MKIKNISEAKEVAKTLGLIIEDEYNKSGYWLSFGRNRHTGEMFTSTGERWVEKYPHIFGYTGSVKQSPITGKDYYLYNTVYGEWMGKRRSAKEMKAMLAKLAEDMGSVS